MPVNYEAALDELQVQFRSVERAFLAGGVPPACDDEELLRCFDVVFQSRTQAYREVLVGCLLAKLQDASIDVHKPYVAQGQDAYNGRSLDERVVNPFLHEQRIPSSRGPFLSTFRRSVSFTAATREGLRDKEGFDALLSLVDFVNSASADDLLKALQYTLRRFIELREAAQVPLVRLQRISLEQYRRLIQGLLATASGGRFPVILVEAAFTGVRDAFGLPWSVEVQGINVADQAAGAGGDITIRHGDTTILAAEVTERRVERDRVVATFQTKIAPHQIEDYLFFVRDEVAEDVVRQARQYFAQGHEMNFLEIENWLVTVLATIGRHGRDAFNRVLLERLDSPEVPVSLRIAWNRHIASITEA